MKKAKISPIVLVIAGLLACFLLIQPVFASDSGDSGYSDSGDSDSGDSSETQITICHVPPDNPGDLETTHIGFSDWPTHRDTHGGDYLGSCNSTEITDEDLVVIKDCEGEYRETLITLTQSYFDPIIVNDDALDDEDMVIALSQCLDNGDSDDSTDSDSDSDSDIGGGYDTVSDSGFHHRISGCNDLDSSDSNHDSGDSNDSGESDSSKNYGKKLRERNDSYNDREGRGDSSINISDSSLDDSGVYVEYKSCADSDSAHIGDSDEGDSGHKYRIMNNCSNTEFIKDEIEEYKEAVKTEEKYEKRPIILNSSSLADKSILDAVEACTDPDKGGGTQVTVTPDSDGGHTGKSGRLNWRELTNN